MKQIPKQFVKASLFSVIALAAAANVASAATINKTLCVRSANKTMSDGVVVTFWGFTDACGGMGSPQIPGPAVEVGIGDTLNLTLNMMMAPQESAPYNGHTIHLHGADVPTAEDGVPETNGGVVNGDTYTFIPAGNMAGSYMYHCHVHTVKHLEMGMYGALVVRPKDAAGNFLNQITADAATAFDYVQNYVISSVDPAYHSAVGDSTVFAGYNPQYFLINGAEGKTTAAPATTLATAVNKKVALRLIGIHSVNSTFSIKDSAGSAQSFKVYVQDGRKLPSVKTLTSLDVTPGQRFDVIFTTPSTSGTWYPQFTFKKLRDNSAYSTAYGKVTF